VAKFLIPLEVFPKGPINEDRGKDDRDGSRVFISPALLTLRQEGFDNSANLEDFLDLSTVMR
jgi:hypothetical protein